MTSPTAPVCPTCGALALSPNPYSPDAACAYCRAPLVVASTSAASSVEHALLQVLHPGSQKIALIKVIRELTGLGLAGAKELADSPPPFIIEATRTQADLRRALDELGAIGCSFRVLHSPPLTSTETASAPSPLNRGDRYDVIVESVGPNKIEIIKVIREVTSLGLRECKELTDTAPTRFSVRNRNLTPDQVSRLFRDAGARVRLVRSAP